MKICSIDGCDKKHMAKGLCPPHYSKLLYYGDPSMKKQTKFCSVDGCNEKCGAKGLCVTHYDRKRKRVYIKRPEVKERSKQWTKDNPEKCLGYYIKHLEKYGKTFNMNAKDFQYALTRWAKIVKNLDNQMCKLCDSTKNLHTHHIYPKSLFPKLALDLNNGVTLCKKCHEKIHGYIMIF